MTAVLVLGGLLIVTATVADVAGSLLGDSGNGGWATGRAGRVLWRLLARSRHRRVHWPSYLAGRLIVLGTPLAWMLGMWSGWTVVFLAGTGNVVTSAGGSPANAVEVVYFTGYTLFTLGNGEFQPVGGVWQITTTIATFSGFGVLSLAVTFVIPVVQAATTRRRVASTIALYGTTPDELSTARRNGALDEDRIAEMIVELTETHAAFPALHYLHSQEATRSAPAMIANVGLALGSTRSGDQGIPMRPLRAAILRYLALHPPAGQEDQTDWESQLTAIRRDDGRSPTVHPEPGPGQDERSEP